MAWQQHLRALVTYKLGKRVRKIISAFLRWNARLQEGVIISVSHEQCRPGLEGYAFQYFMPTHHAACSTSCSRNNKRDKKRCTSFNFLNNSLFLGEKENKYFTFEISSVITNGYKIMDIHHLQYALQDLVRLKFYSPVMIKNSTVSLILET